MKRVLITGGAGFIGFHLSKELYSHGYSIDIIDNFSRGANDKELKTLTASDKVNVFNADLLNPKELDKFSDNYDYIYHLAAIIGVSNVMKQPYIVLKDNIAMHVNMLNFARGQKKLKRFIFASTSEVYAGTLQHFTMPVPTPESTPLTATNLSHPRCSYMLSKIYGEALCHQSRVLFTIIRPHNLYGPRMGMSHVIPELLKKAHNLDDGGELEVFSIEHSRTFCYIDDAVKMIHAVAESPAGEGETFNIGNQKPEIKIRDVADIIIKTVGKKIKVLPMPETPGSPKRRCPDMSKTIDITGYSSKVDIYQGIEKTYNWYRKIF